MSQTAQFNFLQTQLPLNLFEDFPVKSYAVYRRLQWASVSPDLEITAYESCLIHWFDVAIEVLCENLCSEHQCQLNDEGLAKQHACMIINLDITATVKMKFTKDDIANGPTILHIIAHGKLKSYYVSRLYPACDQRI